MSFRDWLRGYAKGGAPETPKEPAAPETTPVSPALFPRSYMFEKAYALHPAEEVRGTTLGEVMREAEKRRFEMIRGRHYEHYEKMREAKEMRETPRKAAAASTPDTPALAPLLTPGHALSLLKRLEDELFTETEPLTDPDLVFNAILDEPHKATTEPTKSLLGFLVGYLGDKEIWRIVAARQGKGFV